MPASRQREFLFSVSIFRCFPLLPPAPHSCPLYREHVFAQIKPTTNSRIDLGLCFTTYKGRLPKRLIDTGGLAKKDRITHRIEVSSPSDIDAELKTWLRAAYDLNA